MSSQIPYKYNVAFHKALFFGPYYSYYTSMIFRIHQTYLISTFFADDLSLFCANRSLLDLESSVNDQLKNIHNWLCANKLSLNIKTSFVIFHPYKKVLPFTVKFAIRAHDGAGLKKASIQLTSCNNILKEIGYASKLQNPDSLRRIVDCQPVSLKVKWRELVDVIIQKEHREVSMRFNRLCSHKSNSSKPSYL